MRRAVIAATGSYHPERLVPNAFFDERFGGGVGDWLVQNLNIRQRYWMAPEQSTSDLCVQAARVALARGGVSPEELDLIVLATDTPDQPSPSTASVVQHVLGARRAGTFDLNSACSGFVIGLDVASKYIAADAKYKNVLVLGGYGMSRFLNLDDKKTATLFADGAGAVLLRAEDAGERGFLGARLATEGEYWSWMGIYGGGARKPTTEEGLAKKEHLLAFTRKFPTELNPRTWTRLVRELCDELGLRPLDVDHYVFTQLNFNAIHETLANLEVPKERAPLVMDRVGYTGSACLGMAFDDAVSSGKVRPGELVMFVASGGGLSFAVAAFRM